LVEENDLFAEGMLARRYGNLPLALDKMDRFLERFPSSNLAENAAAERMRLLRTLDPRKAAGAAAHYIQRYPTGFARTDAEGILAGTR
jgi:outer membrane protein assembly factor BamD (BamD/ComL family)